MKKIFIVLIIVFTVMTSTKVDALSVTYMPYRAVVIEDGEVKELDAFYEFSKANEFFKREKDKYSNLLIYHDDKIVLMEYGLALIPNYDCTVNFEYTHASDGFKGYTNGCYGVDALYLGTNDSGDQFLFEISGVKAWGKANQMILVPIEEVEQLTSYYVKNNTLYHQVKTTMSRPIYGSVLNLGPAPDYLEEDQIYVSYNGHYFYKILDFPLMVADSKVDSYRNAINYSDPYYNYYLVLPHRSMSNHKVEDIINYFREVMGNTGAIDYYFDEDRSSVNDILTRSQYYGFEDSFFAYGKLFGANPMMMLALSMNESASGRSSLAYGRNNLFGHAAYDSDVESNAQRYLTIANSVYSHAKNYISGSYANPERFQYHGSHFGDKSSGMSVSYASDPYWAEKAAQYYIQLDAYYGYIDYNNYAIGIKTHNQKVSVYEEDLTTELYSTTRNQHLSFIILADMGDYYKIQTDPALYYLDEAVEYSYDFKKNVGYIHKADIAVVLNEDKIREPQYMTVSYDAQEGLFSNGLSIAITQEINHTVPLYEQPILEGYLFEEWKGNSTESGMVYIAEYRKIESITIVGTPPQVIELANRISLKGGILSVKLEGKEAYEVPITTSMVSNYSITEAGFYDVEVRYGGATTSYQIEVSAELDATRVYLNDLSVKLVGDYNDGVPLQFLEEELIALKEVMQAEFYPRLTLESIHKLDAMYREMDFTGLSIIIGKNGRNLSISGLYLTQGITEGMKKQWLKTTIEIKISDNINQEEYNSIEKIALANNYTIEDAFEITMTKDDEKLELNGPLVFTIDKPNPQENKSYQVLRIVDGQVVSLHSATYANTIKFKIFDGGTFVVISRVTNNIYDAIDVLGNETFETNGVNYYQLKVYLPYIGIGAILSLGGVVGLIIKKRRKKQSII